MINQRMLLFPRAFASFACYLHFQNKYGGREGGGGQQLNKLQVEKAVGRQGQDPYSVSEGNRSYPTSQLPYIQEKEGQVCVLALFLLNTRKPSPAQLLPGHSNSNLMPILTSPSLLHLPQVRSNCNPPLDLARSRYIINQERCPSLSLAGRRKGPDARAGGIVVRRPLVNRKGRLLVYTYRRAEDRVRGATYKPSLRPQPPPRGGGREALFGQQASREGCEAGSIDPTYLIL